MVKRLWIIPVLIMMAFLAGCGGEDVDSKTTTFTLTVEVEGDGAVTPAEGSHRYAQNAVVALKASPAEGWQFKEWVGAVSDTGSEETTINMDSDKVVKVVFDAGVSTTPSTVVPPPTDPEAAQVHMLVEGEGFKSEFFAWNCTGLEGNWQLKSEFEMTGYGKLYGESSFIMPPRPDSGFWESLPIGYTLSGTLTIEGATVNIENVYEDVVFIIVELEDVTLMDFRGTGTTTVTIRAPGAPQVQYSESYPLFLEILFPIIFERHPECN